MFLKSIVLHNFRCFSDLEVSFKNRLTVLVGNNEQVNQLYLKQPQFPVELTAFGKINGNKISWSRSLNSQNGRCGLASARELTMIAKNYQERMRNGDKELKLPIISYYGTGR